MINRSNFKSFVLWLVVVLAAVFGASQVKAQEIVPNKFLTCLEATTTAIQVVSSPTKVDWRSGDLLSDYFALRAIRAARKYKTDIDKAAQAAFTTCSEDKIWH